MMKPFAPVDPETLQQCLEYTFDKMMDLMEKSEGSDRDVYYGMAQGILAALFQSGITGAGGCAKSSSYRPGGHVSRSGEQQSFGFSELASFQTHHLSDLSNK
jgi:hypothetical protein